LKSVVEIYLLTSPR